MLFKWVWAKVTGQSTLPYSSRDGDVCETNKSREKDAISSFIDDPEFTPKLTTSIVVEKGEVVRPAIFWSPRHSTAIFLTDDKTSPKDKS